MDNTPPGGRDRPERVRTFSTEYGTPEGEEVEHQPRRGSRPRVTLRLTLTLEPKHTLVTLEPTHTLVTLREELYRRYRHLGNNIPGPYVIPLPESDPAVSYSEGSELVLDRRPIPRYMLAPQWEAPGFVPRRAKKTKAREKEVNLEGIMVQPLQAESRMERAALVAPPLSCSYPLGS